MSFAAHDDYPPDSCALCGTNRFRRDARGQFTCCYCDFVFWGSADVWVVEEDGTESVVQVLDGRMETTCSFVVPALIRDMEEEDKQVEDGRAALTDVPLRFRIRHALISAAIAAVVAGAILFVSGGTPAYENLTSCIAQEMQEVGMVDTGMYSHIRAACLKQGYE